MLKSTWAFSHTPCVTQGEQQAVGIIYVDLFPPLKNMHYFIHQLPLCLLDYPLLKTPSYIKVIQKISFLELPRVFPDRFPNSWTNGFANSQSILRPLDCVVICGSEKMASDNWTDLWFVLVISCMCCKWKRCPDSLYCFTIHASYENMDCNLQPRISYSRKIVRSTCPYFMNFGYVSTRNIPVT
jgi:hypothetical protein